MDCGSAVIVATQPAHTWSHFTVGVELGDWEYGPGNKPKVTFMTWDFGGQVGHW